MSKKIIFTDNSDPILSAYLKEISKFKIYPDDEIVELIKRAQNDDLEARDLVIKSNLRFVVSMAKKWQNRGVPLMDLINEGNNGLIYSISKFDSSKGVPFISYATHWIKQYIYQSIYWTGREIRLPISQQVRVIQILKTESEFIKEHSRKPTSKEIAEITGLNEEDIDYLAQFSNKLVSVDEFLGGDSENNQVCDVIPDDSMQLDDYVNREFLQNEIEKLLTHLTAREHDVICLLFGIGRDPKDSKQIGDLFGVGTERIRQIKESALQKLRRRFGNKIKKLL